MLNLRPFLAIPYKHKGRDYSGADCGGFIIIFYRDALGINLPDFNIDYDENWAVKSDKSHFIENYYRLFDGVARPESYDIVLFQNRRGIANHGGVVLGYGKFVHCCKDGVLVDSYNRPGWKRKLNGFYRFKSDGGRHGQSIL